jgi:hypothetical protein
MTARPIWTPTASTAGGRSTRARAPRCGSNSPGLNWDGHAYFDSNDGDVPLEDSFDYWNWSRASLADGGAAILYDLELKGGGFRSLALRYGTDGKVEDFVSPDQMLKLAAHPLAGRAPDAVRTAGQACQVVESWVDAPFYSRSVVSTHLLGEPVTAVHESLDMRRFVSPIVQIMLPVEGAPRHLNGPLTGGYSSSSCLRRSRSFLRLYSCQKPNPKTAPKNNTNCTAFTAE